MAERHAFEQIERDHGVGVLHGSWSEREIREERRMEEKAMKSKSKKRILALVLSMVLMLSTGISAMAEGEAANGKTNGTTA